MSHLFFCTHITVSNICVSTVRPKDSYSYAMKNITYAVASNITSNIIYFFHICKIQQITRKYNTLLQKHCEGGLENKPKASQVLDSIILQIY